MGVFYQTNMSPTQFYPFENVINVHHNARGEPIKLEDDLKNCYIVVPWYELGTYTWESIPIDMHLVKATAAHFHDITKRPRLIVSTRERSLPLPPTERAIPRMHFREDLGPIEEPRGSTIPVDLFFLEQKGQEGGKVERVKP